MTVPAVTCITLFTGGAAVVAGGAAVVAGGAAVVAGGAAVVAGGGAAVVAGGAAVVPGGGAAVVPDGAAVVPDGAAVVAGITLATDALIEPFTGFTIVIVYVGGLELLINLAEIVVFAVTICVSD